MTHPRIPHIIFELLKVQDGEAQTLVFPCGARFQSAAEIRGTISNLRQMVEEDELLPTCMLEFIPFMTTDSNSDIGVFTSQSSWMPGHVAEWLPENGEICLWAPSVEAFIDQLADLIQPRPKRGFTFAARGRETTSIMDLPEWSAERLDDFRPKPEA